MIGPLLLAAATSTASFVDSSTITEPIEDRGENPFNTQGGPKDRDDRLETEPSFSRFSIFLDQDVLLATFDEDRNYTMGIGFQAAGRFVKEGYLDRPLLGLNALLGLNHVFDRYFIDTSHDGRSGADGHTLTFAVGAFTPDRISRFGIVVDDRPYSSIISLSVARTGVNAKGNLSLSTELTVGVLGLRLAEVVQRALHRAISAPIPEGWPNQISDGGEPTLRYAATIKYRTFHAPPYADVALEGQGSVGYYTNFAGGGTLRLGLIRSSFGSLQTNPLSVVNQAVEPVLDPESSPPPNDENDDPGWEVFFYASGRVRAVIYNALLEGQFRSSLHTLERNEVEPFVLEFESGLRFGPAGWNFSLGISGRTSEIRLPESRTHWWGSLALNTNCS